MFKQFLNFYINSSIHVALSVFSLTWVTLIEYDIPYSKIVLCFIFFATITGYNFVKYFGIAKFHHRSLANWLKLIQIFSLCCFLLMCYYGFQLGNTILWYIFGLGIITFLYAIPFLPKRLFLDKQHNLRSIGGLKIYLIAFVWSSVTVFLPIINSESSISADVILTGVQRYFYVIVLMFPFEIRDLRYDSLRLSTVPQKIGVKPTKIIGVLLLVIIFFLEFFKDELVFLSIGILLIVSIISGLFLVYSRIEQRPYYSSFWVEGVSILWLIFLLTFS